MKKEVKENRASIKDIPAVSRKVKERTNSKSKTIAPKKLTREEMRVAALFTVPESIDKPQSRKNCASGPRPCPWVSCKYHLYLDVNPETGSIKLNFPDKDVWEMTNTCALDVADKGGITLEDVGNILNLTRERIRQVEVRGLQKLRLYTTDGELTYSARQN